MSEIVFVVCAYLCVKVFVFGLYARVCVRACEACGSVRAGCVSRRLV